MAAGPLRRGKHAHRHLKSSSEKAEIIILGTRMELSAWLAANTSSHRGDEAEKKLVTKLIVGPTG